MTETILYPNREYQATITVDCARFNVPIRVREITKLRIGDSITCNNTVYTLEQNSSYSEFIVFTYNKGVEIRVYLNTNNYTLDA